MILPNFVHHKCLQLLIVYIKNFAYMKQSKGIDMAMRCLKLVFSMMLATVSPVGAVMAEAQTDMTSYIVNPNFDGRSFSGWQQMGMWVQTNSEFPSKSNYAYAERWVGNPSVLPDTYVRQALSLPNGHYRLTVGAQHVRQESTAPATGACIFADWQQTAVTEAADYSLTFDVLDGEVTIGFRCESSTANWMACDNFRLTLLSSDVTHMRSGLASLVAVARTLCERQMEAGVRSTLEGAVSDAAALTANGSEAAIASAAKTLKAAMKAAERSIFAVKTSTAGNVPKVVTDKRYARGATMIFGRMAVTSATDILEQGFCYSDTNAEPTVADERTTRFVYNGGEIYCIDNVRPASMYYIRAYAVTADYQVGYGDVLRVYTLPKGSITYGYGHEGSDDADIRIGQAVADGMNYWNNLTSIAGFHLSAHYKEGAGAGSGTAECSYGGWMSVSQNEAYQSVGTILHEAGHGIGVGTTGTYYGDIRASSNTGIWYGKRATRFLQFWDNSSGVRLTGDGTHLWATNAAQSLSYTINGAHEDAHSDVQYYANSLLMQAVVEDGLFPVNNQLQGLAYSLEADDSAVMYIRNSDEDYGLKSAFLIDNGGILQMRNLAASEAKVPDNGAQWLLAFDPAKQLYRIKNKKTGRYICYFSENAANGFRTTADESGEVDLRLQLSFVDAEVGSGDAYLTLDAYHIMRRDAAPSPQALCAQSATVTGSAPFSNTRAATAQRWVILTEEEIDRMDAVLSDDIVGYHITTAMAPYMCTGSLSDWKNNGMVVNYSNGAAPYVNTAAGARIDFPFIERWTSSANGGVLADTDISQTITELPNGKYLIRASMIAVNQSAPAVGVTGVTFWAEDSMVSVATGDGVPERYALEVDVTDGTLTYGLKAAGTTANWIALDNIQLIYCGSEDEYFGLATPCQAVRVPISNPTFDRQNTDGWTLDGDWGIMNTTYSHFNPPFVEKWVNAAALADRSLSQTVSLREGYYSLQAAVEAVRQDQPNLTVSGVTLRLDNQEVACSTGDGQPQIFSIEGLLQSGDHTFGLYLEGTNANWVAADNFVLRYHGSHKAVLGDVNDDGKVSVADVMRTVGGLMGMADLPLTCLADINGDGKVTVADVMAMVGIILAK